jgi:hypothetical protein
MSYRNEPSAKWSMLHISRLRAVFILDKLCSPALSMESDWNAPVYTEWIVSSVTIEGLDMDSAVLLKKGLALARLYSSGATSMRGFKRRKLGPLAVRLFIRGLDQGGSWQRE